MTLPSDLSAQTRQDSAAVLLEAAKRFEAEGRLDVADALMRMIVERFRDTPAAEEVRRLRAAMPQPRAALGERTGTVELAVWSTLYGSWLGFAVPAAFGAEEDNPRSYGLGLVIGGPLGFLAGRGYARSHGVTEGQARAITWGGTWGTWQAFGWAEVFDLLTEEVCDPFFGCQESDLEAPRVFRTMVAGGLTGILVGAQVARKPISPGLATAATFGSLWGTWYGLSAGILTDLEDDDLLAATLIGGNVGLLTTALLAPRWQLSRNRARLISIAGVAGVLAGFGLVLLHESDDDKTVIGIPTATSAIGLAIGAASTSDSEADRRGGGGPDGASALVRIDGNRIALDLPQLLPMMLPVDGPRGSSRRPAMGVTLLHARF